MDGWFIAKGAWHDCGSVLLCTLSEPRERSAKCVESKSPFIMAHVYVLELVGGRYYVGTSDTPERRVTDHIDARGAAWTTRYPPMLVASVYPCPPDVLPGIAEDMRVLSLMEEHGIEAVRGGSFCSLFLGYDVKVFIRRMLWHARGACLRCGRTTHWCADCYERYDVDDNAIDLDDVCVDSSSSSYYDTDESSQSES